MKDNRSLFLAAILLIAMVFTFSCSGEGSVVDSINSDVWNGKINTSWYNSLQKEFTITTAQQLAGFAKLVNDGNMLSGKTIKLGADISLNSRAWTPIGTIELGFSGIFDGNGHVIKDVFINNPDSDGMGLFGSLENNGEIKNLGVIDSYIIGNADVGGIVGLSNGEISNSYFRGKVEGNEGIGGLVGDNNMGTISNSYSTGSVLSGIIGGGLVGVNSKSTISNSYSASIVNGVMYTGGFVGYNDGEIINSYSTGIVSGEFAVGGFVGINFDEISNSYSTSTVEGDTIVGGFVGWNDVVGAISDTYSIGKVSGNINVGGFVGFNIGEISRSYSAGTVSGLAGISGTTVVLGGFAGGIEDESTIINSFYDKEKSKQKESYGGDGKTTAEMKEQATYVGWDFDEIWGLSKTENSGYPYLRMVK